MTRQPSYKMSMTRIRLPYDTEVFLLEDNPERVAWFKSKVPDLTVCYHAASAVAVLKQMRERGEKFDYYFLDHDLGGEMLKMLKSDEKSGYLVAKYLNEIGHMGHDTVIHSHNPAGVKNMKNLLPNALVIPFGGFDIEII